MTGLGVYRFFSDTSTRDAIDRLAQADKLTVFVGAGASAEVGFPSWSGLLDKLCETLVDDLSPEDAASLRSFIDDAGALTAAERIQRSLPEDDLSSMIRQALYEGDDASAFEPGPLTRAVARLKAAFAKDTRVVTTNYDQLLVTAMRDEGFEASSYCQTTERQKAVIHLHGLIGYEEQADGINQIILTEHDFLAQDSGWRWELVRRALSKTSCLFIGASLTDLNLLLPLHQTDADGDLRHVVVFIRNSNLNDVVRHQAEEIDRKRWAALGVRVVFADNYADVGQFVDEVRLSRLHGNACLSLADRIAAWQDESMAELVPGDPGAYVEAQTVLSDSLGAFLDALQTDFKDFADEVMQLGLFALGFDSAGSQEHVSVVATSDRIMRDARSSERLLLSHDSPWTGVKAMARGTPVSEPKNHYASRWKFTLAVPIRMERPLDCFVGAIVLSSASPTSALSPEGENTLTLLEHRRLRKYLSEVGTIALSEGTTAANDELRSTPLLRHT